MEVPMAAYTADRRLYLDKNGKVVEANDPTRATLLVAAGATLPEARARELGLLVVEEKAKAEPPQTKARKAAPETK
jgi:hypothetical protein